MKRRETTALKPIVWTALHLMIAAVCWMFPAAAAQASDAERYEAPGPYQVRIVRGALCCDGKGREIDLYVPEDAKKPVPVVIWGNGTWATPNKYDFLLRHLASWGMIVTATRDDAVAQGQTMLDSLALLKRGAPVPVDFSRVAAIGHSQGAGGAVNAAIASSEIDTAVAIDLPARNICNADDCSRIPMGLAGGHASILFLSGKHDPLSSSEAVAEYFVDVPAALLGAKAMVVDADHNDIQGQPDCRFLTIGCRTGIGAFLPYLTGWLAWQLKVDPSAKQLFVGSDADFALDPRLADTAISQ